MKIRHAMIKNLKPGIVIENCKLEDRLHKGVFSETWKGISLDKTQSIAMQFMQYETLSKLIQQNVDKMPTPENFQIAKFLNWDQQNGVILWDYLSGRPLKIFIAQLKQIKLSIAVYIARKILETLAYTVSQGLAHGALRPSRILVTADKKIKLTNFGMGIFEQQILYSLHQKNNNFADDIKNYFAPEVIEDRIFDDPKSDIYAVGIILSEMLIGKPCPRQEIPKLLHQNEVPKHLIAVILKAISDFGMRYNHPNEMHNALTKLLKVSETTNKLYIAPPSPSAQKHELEAVPADSEEYRVYQADDEAAKETIDATVVNAQPADFMDEIEEEERLSEEQAKKEIKKILQKTGKIDVSVMFGTFDDRILTPLEKIPIWPTIFLKYSFAALSIFCVLFIYTYICPEQIDKSVNNIFLFLFHIISPWSTGVQNVIFWFIVLNIIAWYSLPFWDKRAKFALSNFFIPFYTTTMAGLMGLSFWHAVATSTTHGIIITLIFLILGIVIGMITPRISRFLRKQW